MLDDGSPQVLARPYHEGDRPLPEAARRQWHAHLRHLGVNPEAPDAYVQARAAELAIARNEDQRVTEVSMQDAVTRAKAATCLRPIPRRFLFGFTYLTDAKLSLDARTFEVLSAAVAARGDEQELLDKIDKGPGSGRVAWSSPASPAELVASLVRQVILGGGASCHLRLSPELQRWLEATLTGGEIALRKALGGGGAFAANIAAAIPNIESHFFSPEPLPAGIIERFSAGVRVVDGHGRATPLGRNADATRPTRVNYAAEYAKGVRFAVAGRPCLRIDGEQKPLVTFGSSRVILGTPSQQDPGFGPRDESDLQQLATGHDVAFLVGAHYYAATDPEDCVRRADRLAGQLNQMRDDNPTLLRHFQYVVPKDPEREPLLLTRLRGAFDSIALNSTELPGVVHSSIQAGLIPKTLAAGQPQTKDEMEAPSAMLDGALALRASLGLSRVHVHGYRGSLLVLDHASDPDRQALALVRAHQLGTMKTANASGEIRSARDLWPVAPLVRGKDLAAVQAFADAVAERYDLSPRERDQVARRWWFRDPTSDQTLVFAPHSPISDRTGGTVSLGDTFDSGALAFG